MDILLQWNSAPFTAGDAIPLSIQIKGAGLVIRAFLSRFEIPRPRPSSKIRSDLSGMELIGRVWEIQMLTEIDEFKTAANGSVRFNKAARKKVKLWFPIWTDDPHQKA